MDLLYFDGTGQENFHSDSLFLEAFQSKLPNWEIYTFLFIDDLVETLKKPGIFCEFIILLYIHEEEEIDKILEQRSLFRAVEIIIILSNKSESLSAKCHQLYPRMVFLGEPNPMTLISVLMKKAQHLLQRRSDLLKYK